MIGRLKGMLLVKQPPLLLVDVAGVGYEVEAPMSTFYQLPDLHHEVILHTHLAVREDAHTLYGFASEGERRMFRSLIKVNGVGAKMALSILSGISGEDFARCIHDNDITTLTRLPGVGKKTAERLVVEMRDRLDDWKSALPVTEQHLSSSTGLPVDPVQEAVSALIALGYRPPEASRLVSGIDNKNMNSEEIIRAALKSAVSKTT